VFAIDPDQQRLIAKIDTGGRPRSVAFSPDGSRDFRRESWWLLHSFPYRPGESLSYVACENGGYVAVNNCNRVSATCRDVKLLSIIGNGGGPSAASPLVIGFLTMICATSHRRLGCRSQIAQGIAQNQSGRRPMGHRDHQPGEVTRTLRAAALTTMSLTRRRNSGISRVTHVTADLLPPFCRLADMPARLCPMREE